MLLSLLVLITLASDLSCLTFFIGYSSVFSELFNSDYLSLGSTFSLFFLCDYEFPQLFFVGSVL